MFRSCSRFYSSHVQINDDSTFVTMFVLGNKGYKLWIEQFLFVPFLVDYCHNNNNICTGVRES